MRLLRTVSVGVAAGLLCAVAPAKNMVLNGGFEAVGTGGMAENWAARAWAISTKASATTKPGGMRSSKKLQITVEAGKAVYGCFTRAIDVSALTQRRLLFSCDYHMIGSPNAQAMVVFFADDFMKTQWETRPLEAEARAFPPSRSWNTLTWHADLLPGTKQVVVVIQVLSEGTLCVDNVVLRPAPDEIACDLLDVGRVASLPATRRALLRVTNQAAGTAKVRVSVTPLREGKRLAPVTRELLLEAAKPQEVDLRYPFHAREAHQVEVSVSDSASGELVWYERVDVPGLVDAVLEAPAFRGALMSALNVPQIIATGRVFAVPGLLSQVKLVGRLVGTGAEATEGDGIQRHEDGTFRLAIPSEGMLIGNHELRIEGRTGEGTAAVTSLPLSRAAPRDSEVTYDSAHRLWIKGQPVFPIGVYYPMTTDDLDAAQQAGFNCAVVPWAKASWVLAQHAAAKGMGLVVASPNTQRDFWERAEEKFGNHPALLGWEIIQRPDAKLIHPHIMLALYQILCEVSPTHLVITALRYPECMGEYAEATDVVIPWELPVPRLPITRIADVVEGAQRATRGHKPVWALIQAAGNAWASDKTLDEKTDGRHPTIAEVRALAYLAIAHGADGLLYYAFSLTSNEKQRAYRITEDAPELWRGIAALNRELSALAPVIGDRSNYALLPPAAEGLVHLAAWRQPDKTVVIAVNVAPLPTVTTFNLPDSVSGEAEVLFENRRLSSGRPGVFGDVFQPYEVHVYAVPNSRSGQPTAQGKAGEGQG